VQKNELFAPKKFEIQPIITMIIQSKKSKVGIINSNLTIEFFILNNF